ncbi:MAG: AraC family transcriptional regulator, partial [Clostridia bacterium]
ELIYVKKGKLNVKNNFKEYTLQEGDFYIVFPHIIHEYLDTSENSDTCMWIFDSSFISEYSSVFKNYSVLNPVVSIDNEDVSYCVKQFISREELINENIISKAFFTIILSNIVQNIQIDNTKKTETNEWISDLLKFLSENFTKKISLDEVSKDIGVSKYHISRRFKLAIGCSFTEYINTMRVNFAKDLLKTSEKSITEIAFECGFESLTSFFRAFRELDLQSPKQYRLNYDLTQLKT